MAAGAASLIGKGASAGGGASASSAGQVAAIGLDSGTSLLSNVISLAAARRSQRRQNKWSKQMSDTAHQREVEDLRRAGLNPILSALGGSGASSPSAAGLNVPQLKSSDISGKLLAKKLAESGVSLNSASAQKALADSNVSKKNLQAIGAQIEKTNQERRTSSALEKKINEEKNALRDDNQKRRLHGRIYGKVNEWLDTKSKPKKNQKKSPFPKWNGVINNPGFKPGD